MKIKFLSDSTINRIAAGEVIEKPASVVKELVENAIDALSTKIDIVLEQAGKNLIIISDNGIGMSEEELKIAIERHTTSKLDEADLLNINSFGFRGEALPSIGAVSKMQITSKARGSDRAYQIQISSSKGKETNPTIHNEGTTIEIRDLFWTTPARLKFLRSDKSELAACIDIVKKIALAHPSISLSLTHDGKALIKVKGREGDRENILQQRVIELLGADFIENAANINLQRPGLLIYGFTSIPTFNRASTGDQFLFVNNRPVKDKLLQVALRIAYQDYLAKDRHPAAVLFLQIDPQLVDVNVHPAKTEVRFHDPNTIRGLLIGAIKDALATKSHMVSTNIAATTLGLFKNYSTLNTPYNKPESRKEIIANSFSDNKIQGNYKAQALSTNNFQPQLVRTQPHAKVEAHAKVEMIEADILNTDNLISKNTSSQDTNSQDISSQGEFSSANSAPIYPLGAARAQLHGTYIISQTNDSIVIIDQHAAHERLGYEKIKKMISNNGLIKQRLLITEIIELPDENRANLLYNHKDDLSTLGLSIEKFSDRSIIVSEVPSLLESVNIEQLIQDLADNLSELGENISLIQLIEHVTETYACHYSIRAGRKLSADEMNALLRQMEDTPFSGQCNHGRPTYIELKLKDIERLFGRT
ncbi:DNA mismatch repair endonuclease MutL [Candidatus Tisiphia endosymbiont of Beris chalybata]|uniref:DNA mismatch repair endonuclease MutL n=1 Tax=Candidatus Tisiphia endosymbiont of Beris chalybata TaxID=3066262 RepID=UPI00312C8501